MGRRLKEIRGCLLIGILILAVSMSVAALAGRRAFVDYEKEVRSGITALLGAVKEQYPDVREEELISILNGNSKQAQGEKVLRQYGITDDIMVFAVAERSERQILVTVSGCVAAAGLLLMLLFFLFWRRREKRLEKLTEYIRRVQRRDYSLALSENSEDELSHLQNELYKLTVMLKEGMEREKRQREAVSDAVSDISHQIKTPMTSMQIMTDNLLESRDMPQELRVRFLREIARQIEGVNWLVQTLLRLSRLDADVVEFERDRICAADLAEAVCERLAVFAEVREVSLAVTGDTGAYIFADESWSEEALANIVKNAIEHSRAGQTVTIHIEENDVYTKIEVKDTGEGIAPEDIRHIFDRFYRAKNASPDSVGIGLAMAKTIVEKQGGYIMADSKEGKGTVFTIKYMKLFFKESPESHLLSLE